MKKHSFGGRGVSCQHIFRAGAGAREPFGKLRAGRSIAQCMPSPPVDGAPSPFPVFVGEESRRMSQEPRAEVEEGQP